MELWHFLGGRWAQYLKLPEQLSQCRSLTDLVELQSAFLAKFANDYLLEAGKLAGSVAERARHAQPLISASSIGCGPYATGLARRKDALGAL
jgi:hypothetical protein